MAKATLYGPEIVDKYTKMGYWSSETLSDFWDKNAREYPDKEAIVDSKVRLTWATAKQRIDRLALGLLEMGFKKDDMIVAQLPNCVERCLLFIACEKAGLLFLPVARALRHKELEYILKYVEAKGVVIPREFRNFNYFKMIQEIRPGLKHLKHIFVTGDDAPHGAISIKQMLANPLDIKYPPSYLQRTRMPPSEISLVQNTTGTTGFPKFVESPMCGRIYGAKVQAAIYKLTRDDIFTIFAVPQIGPNFMGYFISPLIAAKAIMLEHFEAEEALNLIEKERVTVASLVPAMLSMMVKHPDLKKYDLSSLRFIESTGSPLPYQQAVEAEEKLGCPVIQIYGAVDFGVVCIPNPEDPPLVRLTTVGKRYSGSEVRLLDDSGSDVKEGEVGEIIARGPASASGYFRDTKATWESWSKDGWFNMGDLGKFDKQGNLSIVGRKKQIIIRGGQNIYPTEIENILITHPGVSDVAIVGMPDTVMGERACAFVTLKAGQNLTFEQMVSFFKDKSIAAYKFPERLEILDKLPMLAGDQKVDKRLLQQEITQKLKAEGKV